MQQKFQKAQEVFEVALNEFPEDKTLVSTYAMYCLERGDLKEAAQYFKQAERLGLRHVNPATYHNYNRLKETLEERDIQLVAVQYPMRSVKVLKKLLCWDPNVIYVDNERVFKDAVKQQGYTTLFVDTFAGDFGHCTEYGNRLLAKNIADTIIRDYFRK
jgi:tetratricopeptide (TPR) repeat protein